MGPARLVLTILAVADLERSARFYATAFGWPARVSVPSYVELELPDGNGLGLYRREGFAVNTQQAPQPVPSEAIAGHELYFRVDDLDEAERRLRDAGARQLAPRAERDWGDEASYWRDPDGTVLVVARSLGRQTE